MKLPHRTAPHRTAPHRTAPHRTAPLLLLLTAVLTACGSEVTQASNDSHGHLAEATLLNPGKMPIAKISGSDLGSLSLKSQNPLTKDGWVEYTFSNGEKLLYRNYKGTALYGDIAYADSDKMPTYIKMLEGEVAGKGEINGQSIGLNPSGCSVRVIFCTVSTSAYLWTGRQINYYYSPIWTEAEIQLLEPQVREWNNSGAVMKWNRIYSAPNGTGPYVLILPVSNVKYCGLAPVGFQGKVAFTGGNYIRVSRDNNGSCINAASGTLQHEMGHVVGLQHEQSRSDRGRYVTIGDNPGDSPIVSGSDITTFGRPFDYDSIMLYQSPYVYAKAPQGPYVGILPSDGRTIARKSRLTPTDVATINSIYARIYLP